MFRTAFVLGASVVLTSLVGCGDTLGPVDDFQLPEPDLSLDPDRLTVGAFIATPCAFGMHGNRLVHLRDRHEWARILLSSIPDLVREGEWITVRDVPDATQYDLDLSVGYSRPIQNRDFGIIAAYGG